MNKIERKFQKVEIIPGHIDNLMLSLLFLDLKNNFKDANKHLDLEDLDNNLMLSILIDKFPKFSDEMQQYLKNKIISKLNKNFLLKQYIVYTCDYLLSGEIKKANNILCSLNSIGYIKKYEIEENYDRYMVRLTMPDDSIVKFSNVPLEKEIMDAYKTNCHEVTSFFVRNQGKEEKQFVVVALEKNILFGKHYHSFYVENDLILDMAHNVIMSWENYKKIFGSEILVYEKASDVIKNIDKLESSDKVFRDSNLLDLLKYGILKQIQK